MIAAQDIHQVLAAREETLASYCRHRGIRRLSLFGSHLNGGAGPDSDVDLLVEFEPERRVSLFEIGGMIADLSDLLGRPVDLRSADDLSPYFRESVVQAARPIYAA